MKKAFQLPEYKNYEKKIFVITDGAVWDPQPVIELVKKSTKFGRVYTVGIGNGCST